MLRGLWRLTALEVRIFVREPMGLFGTVVVPVLVFIGLSGIFTGVTERPGRRIPAFLSADLPIFAAMLIAASTLLSLVTIIAIYREGGILKRLRATPLRPQTILTAHVLVKLLFTAITIALLFAAGRRYLPADGEVPLLSFGAALLFSTASIVTLGFVIASAVPTARFAQPIGAFIVYPLIGLSGLFFPVEDLPPAVRAVAFASPFTWAVSLLRGIWHGAGWIPHLTDVAALTLLAVVFTALAARVFRWE